MRKLRLLMTPPPNLWIFFVSAYNIYLTIIQYFVPLFIIDGAYIIIGYKVWLTKPMIDVRDERSRMFEQNKKRVCEVPLLGDDVI